MKFPTVRRPRQGGLVVLLVAVTAFLAVCVDWSHVGDNFWSPSGNWRNFLLTVQTVVAFVGGLVLALVLALTAPPSATRSIKRRSLLGGFYVLLALAVVLVVLSVDWSTVHDSFWSPFGNWHGFVLTIYTALAVLVGLFLGLVLALMKLSPVKRTVKQRLRQRGLYLVLAAVVVLVVVSVNWTKVHTVFWTPGLSGNWGDLIVIGAKNTVIYTAIAFVAGLAFALILALMKLSSSTPYRWIATVYIELFRGLPAMITILAMAFGVPIATGWHPPGGTAGAGVVGLIIVASAYMAETLRAGIQAVPKGQAEAARSLGMSSMRTMVHVVVPQAFRIIIPPLTNEFVLLLKDTSLLSVVGATFTSRELTNVAKDFMSTGPTAGDAGSLTQAAILYLVITLPLTQLVAWLERRQQRAR